MKPKFHDRLILEATKPYKWKLHTNFRYTTMIRGKPEIITVKAGTETDLASIPRIFRSLIPVNARHRGAAVIHDELYRRAGTRFYTRKEADDIFLEAMKVAGVPIWRRMAMYSAVRTFAWGPWGRIIKALKL